MPIALIKERSSVVFDFGELQRKLEENRYYGTLTMVFQDGQLVLIREERTVKPADFRTIS